MPVGQFNGVSGLVLIENIILNADLQLNNVSNPFVLYSGVQSFYPITTICKYINATTDYNVDQNVVFIIDIDLNGIGRYDFTETPVGSYVLRPDDIIGLNTPLLGEQKFANPTTGKYYAFANAGNYVSGDGDMLVQLIGIFL